MPAAETPIEHCARCGAEFGCGATTGGCWCATVDVPPAVLLELDRIHDGCLCPGCLQSAAAGMSTRTTSTTGHGGSIVVVADTASK
jgi:hypothetical protein